MVCVTHVNLLDIFYNKANAHHAIQAVKHAKIHHYVHNVKIVTLIKLI